MTIPVFVKILFVNCFIVMFLNMMLAIPDFKSVILGPDVKIVMALGVYGLQLLVTYYILNENVSWLTEPLRWRMLLQGFIAFLIVMGLSTFMAKTLDPAHKVGDRHEIFGNFMTIFVLNSIPGALMEEWLFRYLPARFARINLSKITAVLLFIAIIIVFTLVHLPAYLFQYGLSIESLNSVFFFGIIFFVIYFLTGNLIFTVLFHAFYNNSFFFYESAHNHFYYYISSLIVVGIWSGINYFTRSKSDSSLTLPST